MFKRDSVSKLMQGLDLLLVLGYYGISLKKSGVNMKALSPFFKEKTPSFMVKLEQNFFKCFSSGYSGDCIEFVRKMEACTFPEALEILAKIHNVELETEESGHAVDRSLHDAYNMVCASFRSKYEGSAASEYVQSRGWSAVADKYGLGMGFNDSNFQNSYELSGISYKNEGNNAGPGNFMAGRLVFPARTRSGQVVAFSGRALDDGQPKYINSRETDLFHKSEFLYGLFENRLSIVRKDGGYLVEGASDVISMDAEGVDNSLGVWGTAFTGHQCRQCLKLGRLWVIAFDGDSAGRKSCIAAVKTFLDCGSVPHVHLFPDGIDPGNGCKNGALTGSSVIAWEFLKEVMDDAEYIGTFEKYLETIDNRLVRSLVRSRFVLDNNIIEPLQWPKNLKNTCYTAESKNLKEQWEAKNTIW